MMRHSYQGLYRLFLGALLASCLNAAGAAPDHRSLQSACKADSAPGVSLDKVQVRKGEAAPGDLPYYEARSETTGNSVRIYHEPDLDNAAASKAACLIGTLDLLSAELPHFRGPLAWSPLVLTHKANYIPPKRDGEARWSTVFESTTWGPDNLRFLLVVMPHEETHLSQHKGGAGMPRWFEEGHAEWAGLHVTAQVRPDLAMGERVRRAEAASELGTPHLGAWGGIQVKPEAIERQLSASDRERRLKDPDFVPPGPFSFGPGDFAQDNSGENGRYGAAFAVFAGLEQRHGREAVKAWVQRVLESKDAAQIVPLAQQMLGEDLGASLK